MSIPNASKYVIIGAGIHGLSTAYHLALELKKRNLGGGEDILVIDKSGIGCLCVAFIGLAVDNLIRTWAERRKRLLGLS